MFRKHSFDSSQKSSSKRSTSRTSKTLSAPSTSTSGSSIILKYKLTPVPDIHQFDNEPYLQNPLLHFRLSNVRYKTVVERLQLKAIRLKRNLKEHPPDAIPDDVSSEDVDVFRKILLHQAEKVQPPPMHRSWERNITGRIPKHLRLKYSKVLEDLMGEAKREFTANLQRHGVNRTLKPLKVEVWKTLEPAGFKFGGRSPNYNLYLKRRTRMKKILFLPRELMQKILILSNQYFPTVITDYSVYRQVGLIDFAKLKTSMIIDLKKGESIITSVWYPKVVKGLRSEWRSKDLNIQKLWPQYMRCLEGFVSLQITEFMRRTIEHVLEVIADPYKIPFIKTDLFFEREIEMIPSLSEVYGLYHNILNDISQVAQSLLPLKTQVGEESDGAFLKVQLAPWYLEESHIRMQQILDEIFNPLVLYIKSISDQYSSLYGSKAQTEMAEYENNSTSFEAGYSRVLYYNKYIEDLKNMYTNEYFNVSKLCQNEFLKSLRKCANALIDQVLQGMLQNQEEENLKICSEFEIIKKKALEIPRSTEQLMESGTYMVWVKTVFIEELRSRITHSLTLMAKLMELTTLSDELIALNTKTINWVSDIKPIFEKNALNTETYKYEFEENLQAATVKLTEELRELIPYLAYLDHMDEINNVKGYMEHIRKFVKKLFLFDKQKEWINKEEALFKFSISQYQLLDDLKNFIFPFYSLIYSCVKWQRYYFSWMDGSFEYLDGKFIEETTECYIKDVMLTLKNYKNKIRQDIVDNAELKFKGIVDDPNPDNLPAPLKICSGMLEHMKEFQKNIPIVNALCNPALKQRHWDEMSEIVGYDLTPTAGTTLRKMIGLHFESYMDQFEVISMGACKELQLYVNLTSMQNEWSNVKFCTCNYKDTGLTILTALDDVQAILDDHIVKTLQMRGSAFVKPFEEKVKSWYDKLIRINSTIDEWGNVQAQWLYLLPIFSSNDIVKQMPDEAILFQEIDAVYQKYMVIISKDPHVIITAAMPGLLEDLQGCTAMLDTISVGVNSYLEKKRLYFSRFFFLSNDEMLEILSETKDPRKVQPHLNKCFEGINTLNFDEQLSISSMISSQSELIPFQNSISTIEARGSVEKWLLQVEEQMFISVRQEILGSYLEYPKTRRDNWVNSWPGQIVICVSQIYWAAEMHQVLQVHLVDEIRAFHSTLVKQLNDIVSLIRSPLVSNLNRITIKALIVIDVHAKDVVLELIDKNITQDTDFLWLSQMRYYWNNDVEVKITNATVKYAYEYLGNSDRLVITPLTDRCYRTLIGAYHLHLNGAPEGPAGSGKTETIKDLAKALAVQCVVFNCSDGLDYKAMGKFFKGIASSGAWACFDEFNRIELEVLSVVAKQILCIMQAIRNNFSKFDFEGTQLKLNPTCYVCITMNPGYPGRTELPDNLKVLFRTVAMMVPDYTLIAEVSLYSFGFKNAKQLSVKLVTTCRLCAEQLSSQNHYDYGVRTIKSVLLACGNNKRKLPDENEDVILLRSLTDVNFPKFVSHDLPIFRGIVSDIFPGVILPEKDYEIFLSTLRTSCSELCLQPKDSVFTKVTETYEMMLIRHGFMLVGEAFSGKTSILKLLSKTLTKLNEKDKNYPSAKYEFINPKAITIGQLYGAFDSVSYEWSDGIVGTTFRNYANEQTSDRKWIIFDGPVDTLWIENINTVLDDNKKLCLSSGEVITMSESMSIIFEVMDLTQASPATISRCGMIYMESSTLGWQPLITSWLTTSSSQWSGENKQFIGDLLKWCINPTLCFIKSHCKQYINIGEMNLVTTTLQIFSMLLDDACTDNKQEDILKYSRSWIQAALVYSVVWGLGGILNYDSRVKFDEYYKEIWKGLDEENPIPEILGKVDIAIPSDGMLIDYAYLFKLKGCWKYWPEIVKAISTKPDETSSSTAAVIPTIDTVRYMSQLEMHVRHKIPMLLVGPTGTGKSLYIKHFLMNRLSEEKFEPAFITFTSQTSANQTQELIISKLQKRKRGIFGPPKEKSCVIFVDDLNMPAKEKYGAQPPIELLRQYIDHKHWYDMRDNSKLFLKDIFFVAAMGLPGGSRQEIYSRFLRHFCIYSISEFTDDSINKIFSVLLCNSLKKNNFPSDIMSTVLQVIAATLDIYKSAAKDLRPTPLKSHYIFNLRDIARVTQGCALMRKESAENRKIFGKLWVHEILRVFSDRLIDQSDKDWLFVKIKDCCNDYFKDNINIVLENYVNDNGEITTESLKNLMFGTFMDTDSTEGEKKYEEIPNFDIFLNIAKAGLDGFNAANKNKMDLVFFKCALEHLSRVCRILAMPSGNALLIGESGSGRQSLTRLASSIMGYDLFQPEISKNYNTTSWRNDLKKVLRGSGGIGKDLVFLFTEDQINDEIYLQDIDCLLNSGEVPNIYEVDEKQEIIELVRLEAQGGNRNLDVSLSQIFSFFIGRVKAKLHIILSLSPTNPAFRNRLRLYPSIITSCTINWFDSWPEDSLEMLAKTLMFDINLSEQIKDNAVSACKYFHIGAQEISDKFYNDVGRKTYVTSASYLDLIKGFTKLTNFKQTEIKTAKMRYIVGLEKLMKATDAVAVMQKELNELKPQLLNMAEKSAEMSAQIAIETAEAERATAHVRRDEKIANVQAANAQALKRECEADLAQAIPILEEALSALNTLKPTDITLVKSMKNPPDTVKLVMAAVCVIKNISPDRIPDPATGKKILDYWGPSKKILGDMTFLQQLKDFDKDNIPIPIMQKIRKEFIPNPNFKPNIVAKASSAAEGLCKWIIAMDLYDEVAKIVGPKKAKLEEAERDFAATMANLNEKRSMAAKLEEKVAMLNRALAEANAKKQKLQDDVTLCINKLYRAEKLIGGLGGEKSRWMIAADNLQNLYNCLAGDVLVSCGVLVYLAPLSQIYRNRCIDEWRNKCTDLKIPCSKEYSFASTLGSEIKNENWYIAELPNDSFSTDNAIIQDNSRRWSLLIDPQGQANNWIKTMEKYNDLHVIKFSDITYMKTLEKCIEYGFPALIENIGEELEAPLDPLIVKRIYQQGGVNFIGLGDNVIPYNDNFRLYLTSKLRNPHYLPEVFNKLTIINFALTITGLEEQLLGIVVTKERPDLQEKRQTLIIQSAANKTSLKNVEDNILKTLSDSQGDILEDETAIEILDCSKILSDDIIKKQKASKETESNIESFRLSYRPMAVHSANLYYCVTDLPNIDPMYQYSLTWFMNLYVISIETSNRSKNLDRRLLFLRETFTYNLYNNVCRSLFEKDKLLFSFIMCTRIMLGKNELNTNDYMFFLTAGTHKDNIHANPAKEWLCDKSWNEVCRLEELSIFNGFQNSFVTDIDKWKYIYDSTDPANETLPRPWNENIKPFHKLILIRILRPDNISIAITQFIESEMGTKYILSPGFEIAKSYEESNCMSPLIFILSPGTDPMEALIQFAELKGYTDKFTYISLGQGQGRIAKCMIEQSQKSGAWVCLQNCHLASSWLPVLEKLWENFNLETTQLSFRLWLTSCSSDKFPTSILQHGVKMTNEPPTGLQANLMRCYMSEPVKDPSFFEGCPGKDKIFTKLLYGICFFHAVIQERKKFGHLGWNIPYGFNDSDFQISVKQLQMFINDFDDVAYDAITYLTGECNYGGRVTDSWDRRALETILNDFVNPKVLDSYFYMFSDAGSEYGLPRKCEYRDYIRHIELIPMISPPEVFGLHANAGMTKDLQVASLVLDSLLLVQGQFIESINNKDKDQILLATTVEILNKIPQSFDIKRAYQKFPLDYNDSMNTVIVQEMIRYNFLLKEIHDSLVSLQKAINGHIAMTANLEEISNSIILGKVPANWMNISYPSLKTLPNYVNDFVLRLETLQLWFDNGKPFNFWLSGLFSTQAFLTSSLQNYARKYVIPIDSLTFDFEVFKVPRSNASPKDGVYVYGLFVDGARWDIEQCRLEEQYPKILNDVLPLMWISPMLISEFKEKDRYKCPLYRTLERRGILSTSGHSTNYVLPIYLNTDKPVQHWIKRSVALVCQLNW